MHARLPRQPSMATGLMSAVLMAAAFSLSACTSMLDDPKAGLSCVDDTKE